MLGSEDHRRPEDADAVALLRSGLKQDLEEVQVIMRSVDPVLMCAVLAGLATSFGTRLFGSEEELDAALAVWQSGGEVPWP